MNERNWINELSVIVDQNKRQIQAGIYAVTFVGFIYTLRSIRPFQKFQHANQIPKSFVDRKLTLNGIVSRIDIDPNLILRVDHTPILASRLRRQSNPGLAVKFSSINVSNNGVSWLQHMLSNQGIKFTLLKKKNDSVYCIIRYKDKNVAEELLKIGFATVDAFDFDLQKDKMYSKYYQKLLKLEDKAEKQHVGIWYNTEYTMFERMKDKLINTMRDIFYKLKC